MEGVRTLPVPSGIDHSEGYRRGLIGIGRLGLSPKVAGSNPAGGLCTRSSVDQSNWLLPSVSGVRIPPGVLLR